MDYQELIERLRVFAGDPVLGIVADEAADTIEQQQKRMEELEAMKLGWQLVADASNELRARFDVVTEVQIISAAYDKVLAERVFAVDDIEYDLFAAGWKAAIECVKREAFDYWNAARREDV